MFDFTFGYVRDALSATHAFRDAALARLGVPRTAIRAGFYNDVR